MDRHHSREIRINRMAYPILMVPILTRSHGPPGDKGIEVECGIAPGLYSLKDAGKRKENAR